MTAEALPFRPHIAQPQAVEQEHVRHESRMDRTLDILIPFSIGLMSRSLAVAATQQTLQHLDLEQNQAVTLGAMGVAASAYLGIDAAVTVRENRRYKKMGLEQFYAFHTEHADREYSNTASQVLKEVAWTGRKTEAEAIVKRLQPEQRAKAIRLHLGKLAQEQTLNGQNFAFGLDKQKTIAWYRNKISGIRQDQKLKKPFHKLSSHEQHRLLLTAIHEDMSNIHISRQLGYKENQPGQLHPTALLYKHLDEVRSTLQLALDESQQQRNRLTQLLKPKPKNLDDIKKRKENQTAAEIIKAVRTVKYVKAIPWQFGGFALGSLTSIDETIGQKLSHFWNTAMYPFLNKMATDIPIFLHSLGEVAWYNLRKGADASIESVSTLFNKVIDSLELPSVHLPQDELHSPLEKEPIPTQIVDKQPIPTPIRQYYHGEPILYFSSQTGGIEPEPADLPKESLPTPPPAVPENPTPEPESTEAIEPPQPPPNPDDLLPLEPLINNEAVINLLNPESIQNMEMRTNVPFLPNKNPEISQIIHAKLGTIHVYDGTNAAIINNPPINLINATEDVSIIGTQLSGAPGERVVLATCNDSGSGVRSVIVFVSDSTTEPLNQLDSDPTYVLGHSLGTEIDEKKGIWIAHYFERFNQLLGQTYKENDVNNGWVELNPQYKLEFQNANGETVRYRAYQAIKVPFNAGKDNFYEVLRTLMK